MSDAAPDRPDGIRANEQSRLSVAVWKLLAWAAVDSQIMWERCETLVDVLELACVLEAAAPKVGNVHPLAGFRDLSYSDFCRAAKVSAPWLARAEELGVGQSVWQAVSATRSVCSGNVNLGICLLLAPLAAVSRDKPLRAGISEVLAGLTLDDARSVYQAIRRAEMGGLGTVESQDVSEEPTCTLLEAMRLAEERDRIAWNYTHDFDDVLEFGQERLRHWAELEDVNGATLVVALQLELMRSIPDSLIARKCGLAVAGEASRRAEHVLLAGWPVTSVGQHALHEFDEWLRAEQHCRNPGTTADLVAAILFAALRDVL